MLGLLVVLAIGAYAVLTALLVGLVGRWARKNGRREWLWIAATAFVMFNLVFWDLVPTNVLRRHYQATEGGVWITATPEAWSAANEGELEGVVRTEREEVRVTQNPLRFWASLNSHFAWTHNQFYRWPHIVMNEETIVEKKTGAVLARLVYFESGNCHTPQAIRFWVLHCKSPENPMPGGTEFWQAKNKFRNIGDN